MIGLHPRHLGGGVAARGGVALLRSPRARTGGWHQDGAAVVVQGLALVALDGWALRALAAARG